jgi:hypothetical protein
LRRYAEPQPLQPKQCRRPCNGGIWGSTRAAPGARLSGLNPVDGAGRHIHQRAAPHPDYGQVVAQLGLVRVDVLGVGAISLFQSTMLRRLRPRWRRRALQGRFARRRACRRPELPAPGTGAPQSRGAAAFSERSRRFLAPPSRMVGRKLTHQSSGLTLHEHLCRSAFYCSRVTLRLTKRLSKR